MMRKVLNSIAMDGVVVIGEGEKDEVRRDQPHVHLDSTARLTCTCGHSLTNTATSLCARDLSACVFALQAPMLYAGERIGDGSVGPQVDIAVDPLDGTSTVAQARQA